MRNKAIYLAIFFLFNLSVFAQNVSVDIDCVNANSAIFGEILIQKKGESYIAKILRKDQRFLFIVNVDSAGRVRNVIKAKSTIDDDIIREISSFITENEFHIYKCYEPIIGYSDKCSVKMIEDNLLPGDNGLYYNNIAFPGNLMLLYDKEKDKLINQGVNLSKIEYLKIQIARYKEGNAPNTLNQ